MLNYKIIYFTQNSCINKANCMKEVMIPVVVTQHLNKGKGYTDINTGISTQVVVLSPQASVLTV